MHLIYFILQEKTQFMIKNIHVDRNAIYVTICKKSLVFATFALHDLLIIVVNVCK